MPSRAIAPSVVQPRNSFRVLGVDISSASFGQTLDRVLAAPDVGDRLSLHFATVHSIVEAQDDPQVAAALAAGVVEPDGMPLVWLGRRRGFAIERVCGPDLMPAVMDAGRPLRRRHYLYGATPKVLESLHGRLVRRYPGIEVVGTHSPPFRALSPGEARADVDRINATRPDYVWVGLGAPKQDLWTAANRPALEASAILAVGAAFDFHAGRRRRAPRWMQQSGIEWLHRLAADPRRLAARYTVVNARFAWLVAKSLLRGDG
jgi:N-acetylglucosaminyldiphosphoundecaprenol N-acetyl-beta-D-mannosaminyltransferase